MQKNSFFFWVHKGCKHHKQQQILDFNLVIFKKLDELIKTLIIGTMKT